MKLSIFSVSLVKCYAFTLILSPSFSEASMVISKIPDGFEQFFESEKTAIRLKNLNGSFTEPVILSTDYQSVHLPPDNKLSRQQVIDYLHNNDIKPEYHNEIIALFEHGISANSQCKGYIRECSLTPDEYEFVYSFNDKELYLFVNEEILDLSNLQKSAGYHSSYNGTPGLVNSADIYFSSYSQQGSMLTLNDRTTIGLPYGYFSSNMSLGLSSESDNQITIYDASYNLDWKNKLIKAGYFQYFPRINTTDFLAGTHSITPQASFVVGTSSNMIVGGQGTQKQLTFYSPQVGDVEVHRDGRIIYQGSIAEGQNSISYNQLPTGRYQVELILRVGGEAISRGNYFVYNSSNDSLAKGAFDYMLAVGQLSAGNGLTELTNRQEQRLDNNIFAQARLSYQFTPSILLGAGVMSSEDDTSVESGIKYSILPLNGDASVIYKIFDEGHYVNGSLSSSFGSLNYEKLKNDNNSYLADYLYSDTSFERAYFSTNYRFGRSSSLYATYSFNEAFDLDDDSYGYDSLTLGYRYNPLDGSSLDISLNTDRKMKASSVYLTWTLPLSDTMDLVSSISGNVNNPSISQISNSIRKNQVFESDDISNSMYLTNTYDRNNGESDQQSLRQSGTFSANTSNDMGRISGAAYVSSDGHTGVSGTMSSTQILSNNSFTSKGKKESAVKDIPDNSYVTSRASTSYVVIDIEDKEGLIQNDRGYLTVTRDNNVVMRKMLKDQREIISLNDYSEYTILLDTESVDLYNTGDASSKIFSVPGTVEKIQPKVHRKVSFISGFNDINENKVLNIICEGEGCISINEMADGVFRITVLEGMDFRLESGLEECFIPESKNITQMNLGRNYCLPTDNENLHAVVINGKGYQAAYVGLFAPDNIESNELINQLQSYGYKIVRKNIGPLTAVYVAQNQVQMDKLFTSHVTQVNKLKEIAFKKRDNNITYANVNY